jgi:hypothetical protein
MRIAPQKKKLNKSQSSRPNKSMSNDKNKNKNKNKNLKRILKKYLTQTW